MADDSAANWNDLARIHDVDELGERDRAALSEIADVLRRNSAQDRFGVTLLHSHFDLHDGEVLVERVDPDNRRLSITTETIDAFETVELIPTAWRFIDDQLVPLQYCHRPKGSVYHQI